MKIVLNLLTLSLIFGLIACEKITVEAATAKPASAANSASTNIAIVKKQKLKYQSESVGVLMHGQDFCVSLKKGLYEQSGKPYTPSREETLTAEQIIALFDVKVEEYFKDTHYARIESGRKIDFEKFIDDSKDGSNPERLNCKIPTVQYTVISIEKLDKSITIQATKDGGLVEAVDIPKDLQKYRTKETPFEFVKILDVNNSKYKCGLNENMQLCYLKDMQVHPGTGKYVVVQIIAPEPGSKHDEKLYPERDAFYDPFKGTARAAGMPTIEENVSIVVGEAISDDKFEIPAFAKNYKATNK
jgi:hypothetical protein